MTDNEFLTLWHRHPELHQLILRLLESDEQSPESEDLPDET